MIEVHPDPRYIIKSPVSPAAREMQGQWDRTRDHAEHQQQVREMQQPGSRDSERRNSHDFRS